MVTTVFTVDRKPAQTRVEEQESYLDLLRDVEDVILYFLNCVFKLELQSGANDGRNIARRPTPLSLHVLCHINPCDVGEVSVITPK